MNAPVGGEVWFLGIETGGSAIHDVFPKWAAALGLDATLVGVDLPAASPPDAYHRLIDGMEGAGGLRGMVITSHKVAIHDAVGDRFAGLTRRARMLGEVSSIRVGEDGLYGDATDLVAVGKVLDVMVPSALRDSAAEIACFGSGGSARSLAVAAVGLGNDGSPARMPSVSGRPRLHVVGVDRSSLDEFAAAVGRAGLDPGSYLLHHHDSPEDNDRLLGELPAGSLVVNATGLGKDAPGSPLSGAACFPPDAVAWDLNYRGDLQFLTTAAVHQVTARDGWDLFLRGWVEALRPILDLPAGEDTFDRLATTAAPLRPPPAWRSGQPGEGGQTSR